MTDIVERLRERAVIARDEGNATATSDAYHFEEAADEIERLRAALRDIVEYADKYGIHDEGDGHALVNIARAALEGNDD